MEAFIAAVLATNLTPSAVAVVAIDDSPAAATLAQSKAAELAASGTKVLAGGDLLVELVGAVPAEPPDRAALETAIERARNLDAEWKTADANRLRQSVIDAIQAARPDSELARIGARASHELAGSILGDDNKIAALTAARESLRLFGDVPLDRDRLPPTVVSLFEDARAHMPEGVNVTVTSTRPAKLYAGGRELGLVGDALTVSLPPGTYFLWLQRTNETSLAHKTVVGSEPLTVAFDFDLERSIAFSGGVVVLKCSSCEPLLETLRRRLGVDEVIAVGQPDPAGAPRVVRVSDSRELAPVIDAVAPTESTWERFHPLYLLPFGGGQFAQGRWPFGVAYLGACLGLAGWQIAAQLEFARLNDGSHLGAARDMQTQADVSFWLLVGVSVATIGEALLVGALFGDEPGPEPASPGKSTRAPNGPNGPDTSQGI